MLQCALGATALHYIVRFGAVLPEPDQEVLELDSSFLSELMFPFPGKLLLCRTCEPTSSWSWSGGITPHPTGAHAWSRNGYLLLAVLSAHSCSTAAQICSGRHML